MNLKNYIPKVKIETEKFIIRMLEEADAQMDLTAVCSSFETIKKQRGGTWPSTNLNLEENEEDLRWHEKEFMQHSSFAYAITTLQGDEELGCIYFFTRQKVK